MQPTQAPELTRTDLEAFLDGLIPSQLQNRNIAGAVISVVKDGQPLLEKGYGYADFEAKKPVVAAETLFRPGSISKLFTAIAVMQLVEQGKLDLDKDVNEYVEFDIPPTYPEPVTLRRILTHTAGFEEALKNLFVAGPEKMKPLPEYLVAALPGRIFPPGKIPGYSNYGLCLAGYIVERISGEKFETYIDTHILQPLKMRSSTFSQPLPPALETHMSRGYGLATKPAKKFEFVQAAPAGSLSATASDMSRFMLAILNDGKLEDGTILKPETVREMEKRQFELHPELNGIGLVFFDYSANNQRIVGHGGDTLWFHSDMCIMPDAHVGLFISYNSAGLPRPTGGRGEVKRAFLDRYFPNSKAAEPDIDPATAKNDAGAVAGAYYVTRRSETNLLKVGALLGQTRIRKTPEGLITLDDSKNVRGELKKWREIGPLVYREVDGQDKIAFRRGASGKITDGLPQLPIFQLQRVPWYEDQNFIAAIVGTNLALCVLTVLLWPVAVVVRKRYDRPLFSDRTSRVFYFISRLVCLLEIAFIAVIAIPLSRVNEDISFLGDGLDPWLKIMHGLGWAMVVGIVILVVAALWFLKGRGLGWWGRVHALLLALGGIGFALFAWHSHLLDASLKF